MRLIGGCAAVSGHHLAVMRLFGKYFCGYSAAAPRLVCITLVVMRLMGNFVAVIAAELADLIAAKICVNL